MALQIVPSMLLATGASFLLTRATSHFPQPGAAAAAMEPARATAKTADWPKPVWQVEQTAEAETWSNGLRIDTRFRAAGHARSWQAFPIDNPRAGGVRRSDPAGIVFHSLPSAESLPAALQSRYACNFLIDGEGQVYRIVAESEASNASAESVWADDAWLYVHLNDSFISIVFEGDARAGGAQVQAGAMLVEMLRSRYSIPAADCVPGAWVTLAADAAPDAPSAFPLAEVAIAERAAADRAGRLHMTLAVYRRMLGDRYRQLTADPAPPSN